MRLGGKFRLRGVGRTACSLAGKAACTRAADHVLGHALDPDADPNVSREIGSPTLVVSMAERRIVCVASGKYYCLALSAEGEVYSWGDGAHGALGHGDLGARAVPSRIESLSRIESITASYNTSAMAASLRGGRCLSLTTTKKNYPTVWATKWTKRLSAS